MHDPYEPIIEQLKRLADAAQAAARDRSLVGLGLIVLILIVLLLFGRI